MTNPDGSITRRGRMRRRLLRIVEALRWLVLVSAIGGVFGAMAWLVRHYG
jgi:hypothetical protein